MEKYFILFSNCIPVKGYKRSIICDLQMGDFHFIPNELYEILDVHKKNTHKQIIEKFGLKNREIIDEYFDFLIQKKFGFWNDKLIPQLINLPTDWRSANIITNAIIDINESCNLNFEKICDELDYLNCYSLEIRIFAKKTLEEISDEILSYFSLSTLRSLVLLIQYEDEHTLTKIEQLAKKHPRLSQINISNSNLENQLRILNNSVELNFIKREVLSESCCGIVSSKKFSVNIEHFTESVNYNTCLNRKISIDVDGNIKNCPSIQFSYGNISNTTLKSVVKQTKFNELGKIKKEDITICKDCEFRHICTDCRAFTESNDLYGKPLKCKYNPYKAEWNEEVHIN